jgi:flagellar biosynthesis/type III secretory pathway M-ring protein FliF/YscJ
MEIVLAAAIVVLVAWFVTAPLRRRAREHEEEDRTAAELADLEARKEAKYREIRDAEADRASGKLSEEDFRRLDRELRSEAVDLLKRIDRLRGTGEPKRDT